MLNFIIDLVKKAVNCLAPQAEIILRYLQNYDANFEELKDELQKLKDERMSIQRRVSEAENNLENIEEKVKHWLEKSTNIIDGAAKVIQDEETTNDRCFNGLLCPNLVTRYQLSERAETKVKALVALREEATKLDRISYPTISEEIWIKSRKGYEAFESRLLTLKSIRSALTDDPNNVSIIGVYGMGGTGKTTLVKEVARQAKEDMLFDQVVFSEVSQEVNIKNIQEEIANKLGLVLHEKDEEAKRANRLYDRLKVEKKILIVLDNLWKHVDLESLGIPYGEEHKGCKILLTARDRSVLLRMGSEDNFLISALCEEEAWRLFKMMAGGDGVEKGALKCIAYDVAQACQGLPIALTTIARALRSKSVPQWENALQELRTPSIANFEGVPAEAYKSIELSYKFLKGEQLKKTFLLCSLTGSGSIVDLFKYGMGMGLFQGVNTMKNAHIKLYAWVHELIDSCLLLEDRSSDWFSMHDVVRDVAISIACRDGNVFLVRNEDVEEWPDLDTLKKCSAICLRDISLHEHPKGLDCSQLEFLCISCKESFSQINISPNFFTGMRKLRVVDFTKMQLFSLPSSIAFLVNLQTLCLDQGKLGDIGIIGKLKNLEVLSLVYSDILQLPKELGQLTKLKLLDLTDCFRLKVIAPNVISSLTRLEELYMGNCFIEWEVDGPIGERGNASLAELMHLSQLTTLEINIENDNNLPDGFFERKLNRFKISVGDVSLSTPLESGNGETFRLSLPEFLITKCETLRTLKLKLNSTNICSKKLQGIKNVEYLCLDKLQGVKNVLYELDTKGFSKLNHLHVQNNPDFKCIIELMERVPSIPFPILETLTLHNLTKLEMICHGQLRVESLNELKAIIVKQCDALRNIFLLSSAKCLPIIQRIAIIDCGSIEVLFAIDGEDDAIEKIEFTQLRTLCLGSLPELMSFCCEVKTPNRQVWHEELTEITCSNEISLEDKLDTSKTLFNDKVVLPNLEALEMYAINVEKIWHNQLPIMFPRFQNLTRLIIDDCHKLKYIFSSSMVQSFEQLQRLEISNCKDLREIISEEGADQVTPVFVFPQLTSLILSKLPELKCSYPGMHTLELPALRELDVTGCKRVKTFTSDNQLEISAQQPLLRIEKIFTNLEELGVEGKDIKTILLGDFPQHFFDHLKVLTVCQDDSAGFPLELLERLHYLEELDFGSNSYKEILSIEGGGPMDKHVEKLARIKILRLYNLDDLKQLWGKDSTRLNTIFQYLETLVVNYCSKLSILLPPSSSSSVSFRNITLLEAFGCKGLKKLLTSSTAKGLVGLVKIMICGCSAMTQVIGSDEGNDEAAKEEIVVVFTKLKQLILSDLENLTSFCYGDDLILSFPSLQVVSVIGCPSMSTFTTGESITPPRVEVWCDEEHQEFSHWEGDLNTTIQNLHKKKLLEGSSSYSTLY